MNKLLKKILFVLSKWVINKNDPKIIAITGSVGKTSTKDAIYQVAKLKYFSMVEKSWGNLNTEIGVPMAILGFKKTPMGLGWIPIFFLIFVKAVFYAFTKKYPKILILEYGADKPGDIKYLCSIANPDISIVTEVGPAHLEAFKTIENIAKEKMELVTNLKPDGVAILNQDNKYITKEAKKIHHEIIWYHGNNLESEHIVAKIVGKLLKIDEIKIDEIITEKRSVKGRLNMIEGINKSLILDDTYNSNPLSVARAYEKVKKIRKQDKNIKRTIIVLGDMLELGDDSDKLHRKVAVGAKKISNNIILVGKRFEIINNCKWFLTPMDAANYVLKIIKPGDLVLVKGSQGMRMEKIVEKIVKDRDNMRDMLVRQSTDWKKKPFVQP